MTLFICFGCVIIIIYTTDPEVRLFLNEIYEAILYLGIGIALLECKFPERLIKTELVQLYLSSHMWWHIFCFAYAYKLYWLCYTVSTS